MPKVRKTLIKTFERRIICFSVRTNVDKKKSKNSY